MLEIKRVEKGSIAEELGFEAGDKIKRANGYEVNDFIDLVYIDGESELDLEVLTKDGENVSLSFEKDEFEPLGVEIKEEERIRSCKNKCVFCFVDQLPKGMRESLYVKDDDWRYSLLCGNYVTLTNLSEHDLERICRLKISPLYVSVHAGDDTVRKSLVANPNTLKLFEYIKKMGKAGIKLHTQIVMCKGLNDGKVLDDTLQRLKSEKNVLSVAVVPVGLTKHRENLTPLASVDKESAREAIEIAERYKREGFSVWCSDEMYLRAELTLPNYEYYDDFAQIENGVGLIAKFRRDFEDSLAFEKSRLSGDYGVITGVSAKEEIEKASKALCDKNKDLSIRVYPIVNHFFGESVTVAGLVTGGDIIKQLKGQDLPETLIIPSVMLKEFDSVFLDGVTIEKLEKELARKIRVVDTSGASFMSAFTR